MGRPATFNDLTEVLREHSDAIKRRLNVTDANMSIPTDGKGLRISVSIPRSHSGDVPKRMEIQLNNGVAIEVLLEVSKDFRPFEPQ